MASLKWLRLQEACWIEREHVFEWHCTYSESSIWQCVFFYLSQRRGCVQWLWCRQSNVVRVEVKIPTTIKFTLKAQGRFPCCLLHLSHLCALISDFVNQIPRYKIFFEHVKLCKSIKTLTLRGLIHSDLRYKVCSPDSNGRDAKILWLKAEISWL